MSRDFSDENLKEAALGVYYHVAQMMKAGKSRAEIEQTLNAQGIKPETTQMMMGRLVQSQVKISRRNGRRNLAVGLVLVGLGLLLVSAQSTVAMFAWLSILIGAFWVLRGVLQMRGAASLERAN